MMKRITSLSVIAGALVCAGESVKPAPAKPMEFRKAVIGAPTAAESPKSRKHQGIPGVEVMPDGELFVCFYANREAGEGRGNYVVVTRSSDGGLSWREVTCVVPPKGQRCFDATLWRTPQNELLLFYAQGHSPGLWSVFDGRVGVWMTKLLKYDAKTTVWSEPRRIADGVMMNKPTVLADGTWVLPVALWSQFPTRRLPELEGRYRSNLVVSRDNGATFEEIPGPEIPDRTFDEHAVIEKKDGSWLIAVRTKYGARAVTTADRGATYSPVFRPFPGGADSRFALRRLASGRLCVVTHAVPEAFPGEKWVPSRRDLAVWLSEDDGATWFGRLMIDDAHPGVAYPDLCEDGKGHIYIVYDHQRMNDHGHVFLARITEADIRAGSLVTPGSFTRLLVDAFPFKPKK